MLAFVRRLGFTSRRLPDEPDVAEASLSLHADDPGRTFTERSPASVRLDG